MGSTASGKTDVAEAIADEIGAQLINADNFQCYRYLNIGTAKPDKPERYELLDILDPAEQFGVGDWVRRASEILEPNRDYIVVGGNGLNIRALFEGYSEMKGPPPPGLREALNQRDLPDLVRELEARDPGHNVDLNNRIRVTRALERLDSPDQPIKPSEGFDKLKLGLDVSPDWVNPRINRRVTLMLEQGWLEEVEKLRAKGYRYDDPGLKAHGYRNLWDVLEGRKTIEVATEEIRAMVRQYAKRQRTWMRAEPNLCKISAEDGRRAVIQAIDLIRGD